jgi:DNA invertase Pin-like site-specific DNA recombinase
MVLSPPTSLTAVVYARVSHDPTGKGRSVDSQVDECLAWAKREGWNVVDVVRDIDRSASRHAKRKREGWARVVELVRAGDVDVLVTWEASRAQRDLGAYSELRELCERTSTLWAYSGNAYDLSDRADRFRTGFDALMAEDESARTSERVCRGVRSAAMSGRPTGRVLYGYRRTYDGDTGELTGQVVEAEQAAIVTEIAGRFLGGDSIRSIFRDLNGRGVATPTGEGRWSHRQVTRVLRNPGYAARRVHRGEVVGPADWPEIIDGEDFDRIQAKLDDPARQITRQRAVVHLLTGIARCGVCGSGLQYAQDKGRPKYGCRSDGFHVVRDKEKLDAFVVATVLRRLRRKDAAVRFDDRPSPQVLRARAEVDEIRRRLDEAAAAYANGDLSLPMLTKIEADLNVKFAEAQKRARYAGLPSSVAEMVQGDPGAVWDRLTVEQRRDVLRSLVTVRVDRVEVPGRRGFDPKSVTILWR